jgi:type I restriction enzyme S subunit
MLADIRTGVTKGRDLSRFATIEVPYLRVANVQSGYLDLRVVKTIKIKASELDKYKLQANDILFTEGGDRDKLGRGTVWRGEVEPCIHQNHIFCARLYNAGVDPQWISLASQLPYARDYFWSTASQTVNLASTNTTNLRAFPVPLPPSKEQRCIVSRIEALFAQADAIEAAVEAARRRLDRLDQAILARAFRGELVPQDPDDEPASVLVERIRQERAAGAAQKTHPRGNKRRRGTRGVEDRLIREWAAAYRLWNEGELARRLTVAGRESMQEKLAAFFDLCETMFQIAPSKSTGLYQAQLRAHIAERERMQRFEEGRAHAESDT